MKRVKPSSAGRDRDLTSGIGALSCRDYVAFATGLCCGVPGRHRVIQQNSGPQADTSRESKFKALGHKDGRPRGLLPVCVRKCREGPS